MSGENNKRLKLIPESVDEQSIKKFEKAILELSKGVPLQYVTKTARFYDRDFYVEKGVFIPRLDSEYLIDLVLDKIKDKNKNMECLDVCTGSGALPITMILESPKLRAVCTDINKKALKVSFLNGCRFNVVDKLEFVFSDVFNNLSESYYGRFDFITANPPYVPLRRYNNLHFSVLREPKNSIVAESDGMDIIEKMLCGYRKYLKKDGFFIFEFPMYNMKRLKELLKKLNIVNCKFYYENNTGFAYIENGS